MPAKLRQYATPEAYRRALEERVAKSARLERRPINRFRQLLLFEFVFRAISSTDSDAS